MRDAAKQHDGEKAMHNQQEREYIAPCAELDASRLIAPGLRR